MDVEGSPLRVLIAGGGFAAVEAALALRALAGKKVRVTMVSPATALHYRPAATYEAFERGTARRYDLRAVANDVGVQFHRGRLESVAPQERYVRTDSGTRLSYDALILATGASAFPAIPGALTFRDQRDVHLIRRFLAELEDGTVRRAVFAVPTGCSWPLPLYELAMLSARRAADRGIDAELSLVTPERRPLEVFGEEASHLVSGLLAERGVRFVGEALPAGVGRDGSLMLHPAGAVAADRVVSVPELRGRRISGVPASWWGFVPTDSYGRVEGLDDVYGAGDLTTFPIKQGGLATQQADRIAHVIAEEIGAPMKELHAGYVLRARLLGGERPVFLRTELDWTGRPTLAALEQPGTGAALGSAKVFARYLTPYLEQLESRAHDGRVTA